MENDKLIAILDKLLSASKKFKVEWLAGKTNESFKTILGNSIVYVMNIRGDGYLVINNDMGAEIGRLSGYTYDYDIKELFEFAKRKALRIDQTLDELDNLLDGLK
jgi:hypothetical protein